MTSHSVAQTLANARAKSGMPVRTLAPMIKKRNGQSIVPSYITDLEKGRGVPSDFVAEQLAKVLGLNARAFLRQVQRERALRS